jgi:uncharacterized membrane protein
MNADLMITIALCLYVLIGSLAMGALAAKSIREDHATEADAERRAAGDGSTEERPRTTRM